MRKIPLFGKVQPPTQPLVNVPNSYGLVIRSRGKLSSEWVNERMLILTMDEFAFDHATADTSE